MARERLTTAAGGVVWRPRADRDSRMEVLLVHRPRYDDWTFPKGKPDEDEDLTVTAVREIAEETGLRVRLGHPLPDTTYRIGSGLKRVSYWSARTVGPTSTFEPNDEVDEVRWVKPGDARRLLTYDHDVELLEAFRSLRDAKGHKTRTLVVLRHAKALAPDAWERDDAERPLADRGLDRADGLVALLGAYGVRRVVSSPATRCIQTVDPYATAMSTVLEIDDRLAEGVRPSEVRRSVVALLEQKKPAVLCTHLPTMPWVFEALGLEAPNLSPGEGVVVHHRKGVAMATEPLGRS
jgi:8-oxo-dGTP diphosphatase